MIAWFLEIMFIVLVIGAVAVLVPSAVLLVEITAALFPARKRHVAREGASRPPVAVLVPAHDESRGLLATLGDIRAQLRVSDRVLVVADNCTDDTAAVAARAGAEVIERVDSSRRGKGYALAFGIEHLRADPPAVVVVVDADCRVAGGSLDVLARTCQATQRPVQALDLMTAPAQSSLNHQVAEFAWRVKNALRPKGLANLGLPCQLMGTGMAFPWSVIAASDLENAHLAEDLRLGLDLAAQGHWPLFCADAVVTSHFPTTAAGAATQRERWEAGHVDILRTAAPAYAARALRRGDVRLLAMVLDVCVPPLSLLALLTAAMLGLTAGATLLGAPPAALVLSMAAAGLLLFSLLAAWLSDGRRVLPAASLGRLPLYALGKVSLYGRLLHGARISHWIRTDRT